MDLAVKITDQKALLTGLVWVLLTYKDGTEFCFQTTLNPTILRERNVILEENKLVRLDKKYFYRGQMQYRQFPYDGATITLWDGLHYNDPNSLRLHEFI